MESRRMRKSCAIVAGSSAAWLLAALLLLVAISSGLIALAMGQEQITVESRDVSPAKQSPSGENELSDTLKYLEKLEKLDQYWSEVARPRFGRSGYKQQSLLGFRQLPQQRAFNQQPQLMAGRQVARPLSLAELINARMAQKYNSDEAY